MTDISTDLSLIRPELFLAGSGLVLLMVSAFMGDRAARAAVWLAIIALLATAGLIFTGPSATAIAFNGVFILDKFAIVMKGLVIAGAVLSLLLSQSGLAREELDRPEYATLVVFSVLGMLVMASANDLLTLYIGFELQSLALYVLAAFRRDAPRSSEAGLKYFVLGGLSSGLLLYGISLIYGYSGTTSFTELSHILTGESEPALGLIIGLVFVAAGLAFKVSAVPFHMWTPDVYEGAPTPITAFFALAPKVAAMALFTRFLYEAFGHVPELWGQIVWFLSVASMVVGSLGAIAQTNIKRLMAYSSIANVGFALVGMATGTVEGVQGVVIYMATYVAMTAGTFGVLLAMHRNGKMVENISDLAGLGWSRPSLALAMMFFMFSYAGIPPFAGFIGKLYVFIAAIHAHFYGLAVIGVLSSVISAFYYLKIIKVMYFEEPAPALDEGRSWSLSGVVLATALVTFLFFLYPSLMTNPAIAAARSLIPAAP
jgi:NADH-quinone oxidoreductase subunit N